MTDRPWMTALEMQFAALKINAAMRKEHFPEPGMWEHCFDTASFLRRSQAFAWSTDAATAAMFASKTIPESSVPSASMLPDGVRSCFWWFEKPLPLITLFDDTYPVALLVGSGSVSNF